MGGEGIRVTKPEEVGPALTSLINSGKPGVLEIVVSQVDLMKRICNWIDQINHWTVLNIMDV